MTAGHTAARGSPVAVRLPALPLAVLGAAGCEDTAITRARLLAAGVPHQYLDVHEDPGALARVARVNGGRVVTPTLVLGSDELAVSEPELEHLGILLAAAGHDYRPPPSRSRSGRSLQPVPVATISDGIGAAFSLADLGGTRAVLVFLAHHPACLTCLGYARQLARSLADVDDAEDLDALVVVPTAGDLDMWREDGAVATILATDRAGAWKRDIARYLEARSDAAMLLVLDATLRPRVVSVAPDAGGVVDPRDAIVWLRSLARDAQTFAVSSRLQRRRRRADPQSAGHAFRRQTTQHIPGWRSSSA